MNIFRSFLFGNLSDPLRLTAIDVAINVCGVSRGLPRFRGRESGALVTNRIVDSAQGNWHFQRMPPGEFFVGDDEESRFNRYQYEGMLRNVPLFALNL